MILLLIGGIIIYLKVGQVTDVHWVPREVSEVPRHRWIQDEMSRVSATTAHNRVSEQSQRMESVNRVSERSSTIFQLRWEDQSLNLDHSRPPTGPLT